MFKNQAIRTASLKFNPQTHQKKSTSNKKNYKRKDLQIQKINFNSQQNIHSSKLISARQKLKNGSLSSKGKFKLCENEFNKDKTKQAKILRNTTPCIDYTRNIKSSLSNDKISMEKHSQTQSKKISKKKDLPQNPQERNQQNKKPCKMSLKILKIYKTQKNTSLKQNKTISKNKSKSNKNQRQIRKSTQSRLNNKNSKQKSFKSNKQKLSQKQILIKFFKKQKGSQKSYSTSKNASKNNSLQKYYYDSKQQLNTKFKKQRKTQKKPTKLKKQNIYCSTKISQRNSTKLISNYQSDFYLADHSANPQINCQRNINIQKYDQSCNINKIKGLKKEQKYNKNQQKSLLCNKQTQFKIKKQSIQEQIDSNQNQTQRSQLKSFKKNTKSSILNTSQNKNQSFQLVSFPNFRQCEQSKQSKQQENQKPKYNQNVHQISLDNFLEDSQPYKSFQLECQQSLKERLSKIQEQSLKQLKQIEFSQIDKIKSLNSFQNSIALERSYSLSSEILKLALNNKIDFTKLNYMKQKKQFIQRVQILDWMSMLSSTMLLKNQTYELAVCYFDMYLSQMKYFQNKQYQKNSLKRIGLGCLILAIKMDERQYQHDILNALTTLQYEFTRKQIVNMQEQIFRKFQSKLKIQTMAFYFDYFSEKWDHFLNNLSNCNQNKHNCKFFNSSENIYLRSIQGKSYQNYRKISGILNAMLLHQGIFNNSFEDLVLSSIFIVLNEQIENIERIKVLEQIKNFKTNAIQHHIHEKKQVLPSYFTQQTLDDLQSINSGKQNLNSNMNVIKGSQSKISQNSNSISLQNQSICKKGTLARNSSPRASIMKNNIDSNKTFSANFLQSFSQFLLKYAKKQYKDLEKPIQYAKTFFQIKQNLQIDPRIYQQSQSYQEFIRYHSYCPQNKIFVIKLYEKLLSNKQIKQNEQKQLKLKEIQLNKLQKTEKKFNSKQKRFIYHSRQTQFQSTSKYSSDTGKQLFKLNTDNLQCFQNLELPQKPPKSKTNSHLDCFLNQQLDLIFTDEQIRTSSNR